MDAIIVTSSKEAQALHAQLVTKGKAREIMPIYPGSTIFGLRFDRVFLSWDSRYRLSLQGAEKLAWIDHDVKPRLAPGGCIIELP